MWIAQIPPCVPLRPPRANSLRPAQELRASPQLPPAPSHRRPGFDFRRPLLIADWTQCPTCAHLMPTYQEGEPAFSAEHKLAYWSRLGVPSTHRPAPPLAANSDVRRHNDGDMVSSFTYLPPNRSETAPRHTHPAPSLPSCPPGNHPPTVGQFTRHHQPFIYPRRPRFEPLRNPPSLLRILPLSGAFDKHATRPRQPPSHPLLQCSETTFSAALIFVGPGPSPPATPPPARRPASAPAFSAPRDSELPTCLIPSP